MPGLVDVDTTLSLRKPEVQVSIDRERASDLGIPVQTIANTLNVLVGGQPISRFTDGTEQYDVWLRADKQFRGNPQTLDLLSVPSPKVGLVELSSLAKVTESRGPSQINRFNHQRTVTILANPDKISLSDATQAGQEHAGRDELAAAVSTSTSRASRRCWARRPTTSWSRWG